MVEKATGLTHRTYLHNFLVLNWLEKDCNHCFPDCCLQCQTGNPLYCHKYELFCLSRNFPVLKSRLLVLKERLDMK